MTIELFTHRGRTTTGNPKEMYLLPDDADELRIVASLIDQERMENFKKAIVYAGAYLRLRTALVAEPFDVDALRQAIRKEDERIARRNYGTPGILLMTPKEPPA